MNQSRLKQILVSLTGSALILGGGAVGALSLLNQPAPQVPEASALPVSTLELEAASSYTEARRYAGFITARRVSAMGFERGGRLIQLMVDDGDTVSADTLLAQLDPARLERERQELLAQLAGAEADLRLAELSRDRNQNLKKRGVASQQTLDETRLAAEAAAARVAQLQAGIQRLDLELEKTRLYAPFDGVVVQRLLDEGAVVDNGTPVLRLQEQSSPEARVGMPLATAARLQPGRQFPLLIQGQRLEGRVKAILPSVDPGSRTVTVVLGLPANASAPDGALVHLEFQETVDSEGFWVPLTALTEGLRGLWTVYSLAPSEEEGSVVRRRAVEVLHVEESRAFVRGTLEPGLTLVADGVHRLVAGQRVVATGEAVASLAGD